MKFFAIALVAVVAASGQGKAIFNVDAYSFLQGTGKDTIPYFIPPGLTDTASTVQKITLPPGFGSSIVDTVRITNGSANLENVSGSGMIGFQLFFASDSAATYTAPVALNIPPTAVNGAQTVVASISGDLSNVDSLFQHETVYVRIAATATNTGATLVQGKGVIKALVIRIVLQDKVF